MGKHRAQGTESSSSALGGVQFSLKPAFHLISEFQSFWHSYRIHLFSCFYRITKIKEDEQNIKERTAEGHNWSIYCLKTGARI